MSELPLVSIVVPAYNAERFLRASLDSILAQTYPRTEILLMDDASTDGTEAIARSYGDRIAYHRQPRNRGQFANVDDGIARAAGAYIAVYHADDVYLPRMVEREAGFLEAHPDVGAVFVPPILIDPEGRERGRVQVPPSAPTEQALDYRTVLNTVLSYKNRLLPGPSSMIPASVYRTVGPYRGRDYPVAADFEMFLRISRSYPVAILGEHLFCYRWGHGNADQLDRRLRTTRETYFTVMDEHLAAGGAALARPESMAAHRAHLAEDVLMRAVNCYVLGRTSEMRPILAETTLAQLLGSGRVQRFRLGVLCLILRGLTWLPHLGLVERAFRRRWCSRFEPAGGSARRGLSVPRSRGPRLPERTIEAGRDGEDGPRAL